MVRDLSRDSTQLVVADQAQTFLDNVLIESVLNVSRHWHQPERRPDAPVLMADRPWEHTLYFNYSDHCVLRDPEDGLFKCWYEDFWGPLPHVNHNFKRFTRKLYAESADGLNWRKPELDLYRMDGRKTNIILGDEEHGETGSGGVVIDPYPPTREERFRMMYTRMWENASGVGMRVEAAHSADGMHWQVYDELPTFGSAGTKLGDVSLFFYDQYAREFVQTTRHTFIEAGYDNPHIPRSTSFFRPREPNHPASDNQRRVWQTRSHDFIHWSEPILIAATDDEDNLDESYYAMPMSQMGNVYLGTVGVLRAVDNETHVQLLMSRDGVRWTNTNQRQPFFAPRGAGYWDARMVTMSSAPIEVGDELWFFYGGSNSRHDWWLMGGFGEKVNHPEAQDPSGVEFGLGLATMRKEGFAGLFANGVREGLVVTQPLRSSGARLLINGKCAPGGAIRVEVTDGCDRVLPGCSVEENDVFTGDKVAHEETWRGSAAIPFEKTPRGWPQVRKLRFYLRDAELFSFRFV